MGRDVTRRPERSWHPVVSEVLATLVQNAEGPTIDEQLALAARIGGLKEAVQDRVFSELTCIAKRLGAAGERTAESWVRSIAALAMHQRNASAIERRVFRD